MKDNENIINEGSVSLEEEKKTYTEEEVQKLLQAEADRRVTEAMKKAEKKKEAAVKEAERLARMNEEEKYKYELEQREAALIEKEKKMALMENKAEASKALNSRGISIALADFVVAEDADTMMENIKILEEEFKKSVKAEVEKRLAGGGNAKKNLENKGISAEEFQKLSFAKQSELLEQNPALYEKFL